MKINLILLFLAFTIQAKAQTTAVTDIPQYQEVVEKFYSKYSVPEQFYPITIVFAKKADGWHIQQIIHDPEEKIQQDELFWNSMTKQFQPLNLPISTKTNDAAIKKYLSNKWETENFNNFPLYGYGEWSNELIDLLKSKDSLSDGELYGLGRAYSFYASNLLNNNSGYANLSYRFHIGDGPNALSASQLATYRKYRHEAINKFNQLRKRNPEFMTIVGKIEVKWANEHVTSYLDLATYQNEKEAMIELPDSLYPYYWIWLSKNFLKNCPPNSILITNGDNDTYPLIYIQKKMKYRTDVRIINYSLLNTVPYLKYLIRNNTSENPFICTLDSASIEHGIYSYLMIGNEIDTIPLYEAFHQIDSNPKYSQPAITGEDIRYFPSKNYSLLWDGRFPIYFTINKKYLLSSDIFMLNHLSESIGTIPFCVASTVEESAFNGLDDYYNSIGLAYLLGNKKITPINSFREIENPGELNLQLNGYFESMCPTATDFTEWYLLNNIRGSYQFLAENYLKIGKKEAAFNVLTECDKNLPDEKCIYSNPYMIDQYYRCDKLEEGNRIALLILHNIRTGEIQKLNKQGLRERSMTSICAYIKNQAAGKQQSTIVNQAEEIMAEIKTNSNIK